MNKKILLPLLILGLGLTACGQKNPPVTPSEPDTPVTPSEPDTPIWEEDLVDGETAISDLINGTDGEYYMVRGTVVGRSGSTMALARGDDFVYCYNFKAGEASIAEYATGNYVEVYAQISHYEGSVQLTAYVSGAYDANAYVEVLEAEGETIAPTVLNADNFSTVHKNTNAGLLLQAEGLVNVSGAFTATGTSANEDAKFTLGENNVTVRLEKYFDQATRADFVASLDKLEATATYTIVALMTASSSGGRLLLLDSSTVTQTAEPTVEPEEPGEEPAPVAVTKIADALTGTEMAQIYTIEGVTVESWRSGSNGTKYGNFNITDGTTSILVYGATATASALAWNQESGLYVYNNPQDFLTNALTSTIVIGSELDLSFVVTSYNSTKQLNAIVTAVDNSNIGGGEEGGDEGGETNDKVITLTSSALGLAAYGNGSTTINGYTVNWIELGCYDNFGIQWRSKNKTAETRSQLWFEANAFPTGIKSIDFTWNSGKQVHDNQDVLEFSYDGGTTVTEYLDTTAGVFTYTVTPSVTANTLKLSHNLAHTYTMYWDSIVITLN